MAGLYHDDNESDIDVEKPVWDDDIDIDDIVPPSQPAQPSSSQNKKKKKKKKKKDDDNDEGVDIDTMDADVTREYDEEDWDGTEEMRKRKLDEYMGEVYGLEFNDMVGFDFYSLEICIHTCYRRLQECLHVSNILRLPHRHSHSPLPKFSWLQTKISINT
jgi:hypothetical protein